MGKRCFSCCVGLQQHSVPGWETIKRALGLLICVCNHYMLFQPEPRVNTQHRDFGISREAASEQAKGLVGTTCPMNFETQGLL